MAESKSPLARVQEQFGDKEKLVAAVEKFTSEDLWVARTNKSKGLSHVSNAKLLRLHDTFTAVKEKFGTREKLIDAILELLKRTKDSGFKTRLSAYPVPRLYDLYRSTAKRAGIATGEATEKKKSAPRPKKEAAAHAAAKPAAKKKAAAPKKKTASKAPASKRGSAKR